MSLPTVDVITVLWKSRSFLPTLFEGLVATDYPHEQWRVHIVDNNPGDGSLDEVRHQMERFKGSLPEIIIHEPGKNTGFSGGNNIAIRQAIAEGRDCVYLHNHDAQFEASALREAVEAWITEKNVGSVQSLLVLAQKPDEVNSSGNAIHYIGFGYAADYHVPRNAIPLDIKEIAYGSGAAVLIPTKVLKEVGLLDETLWLYHEDLDLGWRILLAGYRNIMAPKSVVRHRYEFSRSMAKWFWMERNRDAVMLKNYRLGTIFLLVPQIICADIGLLAFAIKGGWWREKLRASYWLFKWSTWKYIFENRKKIATLRKVGDAEILKRFTPFISYQDIESKIVKKFLNPIWEVSFRILKVFVIW
ncbi:glycosyltransferase [Candidatus Uhrbacteria bacterium]|nr:glycosyltransferase [Candidatus Uhrbacteria bacterium]